MRALLIQWFEHRGLLAWGILIVDSFPVKSFLNTVKCLKISPINYEHLAQFLATVSVQPVFERLRVSPRYRAKMQTKLLALLMKAVWGHGSNGALQNPKTVFRSRLYMDHPKWSHLCWNTNLRNRFDEYYTLEREKDIYENVPQLPSLFFLIPYIWLFGGWYHPSLAQHVILSNPLVDIYKKPSPP